jgi:hypothetical protein
LAVSPTIAKGFLLRNQWNIEQILNKYLDDSSKFIRDMFNLDLDEADKRSSELRKSGQKFCCPVCYDETGDVVSMECGHGICIICYKEYLQT